VPAPTTIASAQARSRWTSARAASPVIHREVPSRAATLPSSEAAAFQMRAEELAEVGRRRRILRSCIHEMNASRAGIR